MSSVSERAKIAVLAVATVAVVAFWGYLLTASPHDTSYTPPYGVAGGTTPVAANTVSRITAVTSVPNVTFLDPLAENWFADAPAGAIASDGQHPTDVGHQRIADRVRFDLVGLGIAPRP